MRVIRLVMLAMILSLIALPLLTTAQIPHKTIYFKEKRPGILRRLAERLGLAVTTVTDLQVAINSAQCGDTLELQAGGTWDGTFNYTQNCPDNNHIKLRNANFASLPVRVGPTIIPDTISNS